MLSRIVAVLNRPTSGTVYWTDTQIIQFIDNAQIETMVELFKRQDVKRLAPDMIYFEYEELKVATTTNVFNVVSGTFQNSFSSLTLTNYWRANSFTIISDGGTTSYPAVLTTREKALFDNSNEFQAPTKENPLFYVSADILYYYPVPTANKTNGATFVYYYKPLTITASQEITLPESVHVAMMYYALHLCFQKAKQDQLSQVYYQKFLNDLPQ